MCILQQVQKIICQSSWLSYFVHLIINCFSNQLIYKQSIITKSLFVLEYVVILWLFATIMSASSWATISPNPEFSLAFPHMGQPHLKKMQMKECLKCYTLTGVVNHALLASVLACTLKSSRRHSKPAHVEMCLVSDITWCIFSAKNLPNKCCHGWRESSVVQLAVLNQPWGKPPTHYSGSLNMLQGNILIIPRKWLDIMVT